MNNPTNIPEFSIRFASEDDVPTILYFIKELARYENLSNEVVANENILNETLFGERKAAEVLLGYFKGEPVCFALFFHNFSTFLGRPGIYLEDLFVKEEMRGKGFGKAMLVRLAQIAVERNCGRLEWWVLDWNESAIKFYKNLGANSLDEWLPFRVTGNALLNLAETKS